MNDYNRSTIRVTVMVQEGTNQHMFINEIFVDEASLQTILQQTASSIDEGLKTIGEEIMP